MDVDTKFNSLLNRNVMYFNNACTLACDAAVTVTLSQRWQQEVDKNQQHILLIAALAGVHPC